jgi:hypothetical protein
VLLRGYRADSVSDEEGALSYGVECVGPGSGVVRFGYAVWGKDSRAGMHGRGK